MSIRMYPKFNSTSPAPARKQRKHRWGTFVLVAAMGATLVLSQGGCTSSNTSAPASASSTLDSGSSSSVTATHDSGSSMHASSYAADGAIIELDSVDTFDDSTDTSATESSDYSAYQYPNLPNTNNDSVVMEYLNSQNGGSNTSSQTASDQSYLVAGSVADASSSTSVNSALHMIQGHVESLFNRLSQGDTSIVSQETIDSVAWYWENFALMGIDELCYPNSEITRLFLQQGFSFDCNDVTYDPTTCTGTLYYTISPSFDIAAAGNKFWQDSCEAAGTSTIDDAKNHLTNGTFYMGMQYAINELGATGPTEYNHVDFHIDPATGSVYVDADSWDGFIEGLFLISGANGCAA